MNALRPKRQAPTPLRVLLCMLGTCALGHAQGVPPRALPVEEPPPRAQPVEEPTRPPAPAFRIPSTAPTAAEASPLRAEPTGPDEDLYAYATLCYTQKEYQIAISPLSDYLRLYPQGRHAAEAWFRLGECHHHTGNAAEALKTYKELIRRFARSDSAASAAYRLGEYAYRERDFAAAAAFFTACSRGTSIPNVKLHALFNSALAYDQAGARKSALLAYKQIAEIPPPNTYRETALIKVATAYLEEGKKQEALTAFNDLIVSTKDNLILADALLRAGLILNEMGKTDPARKNFARVLDIPAAPKEQRGMALFGLIQAAYLQKDYDAVLRTYSAHATTLPPPDIHAKLLLLVGKAQKEKGNHRQAIETFLMLEKNHPEAPEALDAGYQKLLSFYHLNDPDVPQFAFNFEERYGASHPHHEYLNMARLIRADWWFGKHDYAKAVAAFGNIDIDKVPDKVRGSVLYKKGFAEAETGKSNEAIQTLSRFINEHPDDANLPYALAQRGIAFKNVRSFDKALADFASLIKNHAAHPTLEMALYQSGFIKGETRDLSGMVSDFEALLDKFPNSAAAAEVSFRIGKGYFDMNQPESFAKALEPLRKAIQLDRKAYLDKASQLLVACQWLREDVDGMAKEVDTYLSAREGARVNAQGLVFLGVNYYNRGNYETSARYLGLASTPDQPEATEAPVWNFLGMARCEIGKYASAAIAFDNYLAKTPTGEGRARALWGKGRAKLGLGEFDEAQQCTTEGLGMIKEGKLKGQLQILDGDISNARGDALASQNKHREATAQWNQAIGQYVVVSQIFVDPEITPESALKAADTMEKVGESAKASAYREQVRSKYPRFKLKPAIPLVDEPMVKAPPKAEPVTDAETETPATPAVPQTPQTL